MEKCVVVSGTVKLSNGQTPSIYVKLPGAIRLHEQEIDYECIIIGGNITVIFPVGICEDILDEIFRITRHIIDNAILALAINYGIGLLYTLDFCRTSCGDVVQALPDQVPKEDATETLAYYDIYKLMGVRPDLRYAIRDYNQGLIQREDCPIFFYRAIETMAKIVCNKESDITKADWDNYHKKIGTSFDEMKVLYHINKSHRHGTHNSFTKEDHVAMLISINHFIVKTIKYLNKQNTNIIDSEQL